MSSRRRGSTLSKLDAVEAVEKLKQNKELNLPPKAKEEPSPKVKRRSITNTSTLSRSTSNLSKKKKKKDEIFISSLPEQVQTSQSSSAPNSPSILRKRKRGIFKDSFSGLFKGQTKRNLSMSSIPVEQYNEEPVISLTEDEKELENEKEEDSTVSIKLEEEKEEKEEKEEIHLNLYNEKDIVLLQSFWRMISVKKVKDAFRDIDDSKAVEIFVEQVKLNEEGYILILQTIRDLYLIPLSSSDFIKKLNNSSSILDIHLLFPNIEEYIEYHRSFLKKIDRCLEKWPLCDFSLCLEFHLQELTQRYCNLPRFRQQSDELLQILLTSQSFIEFCNTAVKSHPEALKSRVLKSLLNSPLNYLYRLEEPFKKMTVPLNNNSKFFERILHVSSIGTQFASFLQERTELVDYAKAILLIQSGGENKDTLVASISRRFIRDKIMKVNSKKARVFLFSDIIYFSQIKPKSLKFIGSTPLQTSIITNLRKYSRSKGVEYCYTISVKGEKSNVYKCRELVTNGNVSNTLLYAIEDFQKRGRDKVFGISLLKSMEDNPQILPEIFRKLIYHIDKLPDKKDIFKRPGNSSIMHQLRANESRRGPNNFGNVHSDDLAGLLTIYLELLPDCIIPFSKIKAIPEITTTNLSSNLGFYHHRKIIKFLQEIIIELPDYKRNFLEYLTYFLARLLSSSNIVPIEIAYYFTPFIIRCKDTYSIEYCLWMPKLMQIIELLVLRRDKLFHPSDKVEMPENINEFLESESFGDWWKLFRENNKQLIRFLIYEESLKSLVFHLISNDNYSEIASNILITKSISTKIIENGILLDIFFNAIKSDNNNNNNNNNNNITEKGLKWLIYVITKLFQYQPLEIGAFLLEQNQQHNQSLIESISSGSVALFLDEVIKYSFYNPKLYDLLSLWCRIVFNQILKSKYSYSNNTLCNSTNFLCSIVQNENFLSSDAFKEFQKDLSIKKLELLVEIALDKTQPLTACEIHNVISALVVLKELTIVNDDKNIMDTNPLEEIQSKTTIIQPLVEEIEEVESKWISDNNNDDIIGIEDVYDEIEDSEYDEDSIQISENMEEIEIALVPDRFQRTSSFTNFRWSEKENDVINSNIDIERMNLLTIFLSHSEQVSNLLSDDNQNKNILGQFRLGILHLIQVTIFACDDTILKEVIKSKLLCECVRIFFKFKNNNIMHHVVQDIISGILKRNNDTLILHLLNDTPLIQNIINLINSPANEWTTIKGFIGLIVNGLNDTLVFLMWLKQNNLISDWNEVSNSFVRSKKS